MIGEPAAMATPRRDGYEGPAARLREDRLATVLWSLVLADVFLLQFLLRGVDDNRLASWAWVFAAVDFSAVAVAVTATVVLAHMAALALGPIRRPALALALAAAAVAMLLSPIPEPIIDAARHFAAFKAAVERGPAGFLAAWGGELKPWTDLPLLPLVFGILLTLAGEARWVVQAANIVLFAGTVAMTVALGRRLWGEAAGIAAGLSLLAMPILLVQVPLVLTDVPAMFLAVLAVAAAERARTGGRAWLAVATAALAAVLLAKASAWPVAATVMLLLAAGQGSAGMRRAAVVAAGAVGALGFAALLAGEAALDQARLVLDYQLPAFARWRESHLSTFLFQIHPVVTLAAAAGLALGLKRRDGTLLAMMAAPLAVMAAGIERSRYFIPLLPLLALTAGYAVREVRWPALRRHLVGGAAAVSIAIAVFGYAPFLAQTSAVNLKRAGAYLDGLAVPRVEVVALPQPRTEVNPAVAMPLLAIYTSKPLVNRSPSLLLPDPAVLATSPVRFSWELAPPSMPSRKADPAAAVVVVLGTGDEPLPAWLTAWLAGHRPTAAFTVRDAVFRFGTVARIFEPS